ncbi:MAG: phage tail protein [Steroidobacteraceae bacterium]
MSEQYLAEIRMTSFNFAPKGWALCNGQLLAINQYQALFSLLGTTYGGNGTSNFALPNLQGRVPMHFGSGYPQGQAGGEIAHTLLVAELPVHQHQLQASADFASTSAPGGNLTAAKPRGGQNIYAPPGSPGTALAPAAVAMTGASEPHENEQPYLTINFIIALVGIFPSQN